MDWPPLGYASQWLDRGHQTQTAAGTVVVTATVVGGIMAVDGSSESYIIKSVTTRFRIRYEARGMRYEAVRLVVECVVEPVVVVSPCRR